MELDRTVLARANRQIGIQMERRANRAMAGQALTAAQGHVLLYILEHAGSGTSLIGTGLTLDAEVYNTDDGTDAQLAAALALLAE